MRRLTIIERNKSAQKPAGTEESLPLEGKLAQRQLRLMRSKLKIITMGWYDAATFDLIRSGVAGPP